MHSRQHKVQQGFPSGASATDPGKDATGSFPAWIVIVLAAALMMLAGCVDSEEDFKSEHPAPSSSSSSSSSGANPAGSNLTCEASLSGSGTFADPGRLGVAPKCFEFQSFVDTYFSVTIPNTGLWYFQIVDMSGDNDLSVYTNTNFVSLLCNSDNDLNADDFCSVDITDTGTGGIVVENFDGGNNSFRLEVVQ